MDFRTAIYKYCNYQERCHQDVRNKLYDLGARKDQVETLIADLIGDNLLNEERYARAFVRGKFRLKKWGRKKILQELKLHKISEYCVKKGMSEIDANEYDSVLNQLCVKKWRELNRETNEFNKKGKVYRYLLQKGYEQDLISDAINQLLESGS
ncbi:regulatory protein RecX [Taibaiella soli]|uniref:Regulatory protein RecX n=1 Tax=Taibaiella soli TaxID=1649169 RepID=A0A2W2BYK5_9BACT|nr:regulatory protein RecX [Taibaiella soli]PZF72953.1 RecX family transcriptional regulator [Taibaiella soli]